MQLPDISHRLVRMLKLQRRLLPEVRSKLKRDLPCNIIHTLVAEHEISLSLYLASYDGTVKEFESDSTSAVVMGLLGEDQMLSKLLER